MLLSYFLLNFKKYYELGIPELKNEVPIIKEHKTEVLHNMNLHHFGTRNIF